MLTNHRVQVRARGRLALLAIAFLATAGCGKPPDPATAQGRQTLHTLALQARPLILALDRYHRQHARFPDHLEEIAADLPPNDERPTHHDMWRGWSYAYRRMIDPSHYRIYHGVWGHDPFLYYDGSPSGGAGAYDPGTGEPKTPIRFDR